MSQVTYTDVVKSNMDVEVFRAFMAQKHGAALTYGGTGAAVRSAYIRGLELARLSGLSLHEVCENAKRDYQIAEAAA